ncbi:excinuclease ABC subunit A [Cellvibrio polysaccharolyticus]|uniref:Excinuclease ABC subunit A n=1 Tax=Cellvibrio polysaccharolyticus TaxID=2082724 RepID=A0A928V2A2_9GAMM|nr:excinuclease ABC subunit A [Cellvibrio polysaccharolyticus]MBE8715850.1 excinuclease ABC subunit A [Cellvibrio polysaccharolyticus]
MKATFKWVSVVALAGCAVAAQARDDVRDYSLVEALSSEQAKEALGTNIKFYFGSQKHGTVSKRFGEFSTNKKTNGFNKTDKGACEWVFLSALKTLKERAEKEGGNAVVNIRSNYRNNLTSSNETFQCGSGALMSGVALVGDVVTIK